MFNWFVRDGGNSEARQGRLRAFSDEGLLFVKEQAVLDVSIASTAKYIGSPDLEGLLHQLEDEGFAQVVEAGHLLPWDSLYALLENPTYQTSLPVLELPKVGPDAPILESRDSLSDPTFAVTLAGWHDGKGQRLPQATFYGAVIRRGDELSLLNRRSWQLLQRIVHFHRRSNEERTDVMHRRHWGIIRQAAISANARLDDFLYRSVVLTPEKLEIGLRTAESGGTKVVEIAPC